MICSYSDPIRPGLIGRAVRKLEATDMSSQISTAAQTWIRSQWLNEDGARNMSVIRAEILHHCPFHGQLEEAEKRKKQEKIVEDLPRKAANSSCLYLSLGFCRIKGIENENGKRNTLGFRRASRTLKREKMRTGRGKSIVSLLSWTGTLRGLAENHLSFLYHLTISASLHCWPCYG